MVIKNYSTNKKRIILLSKNFSFEFYDRKSLWIEKDNRKIDKKKNVPLW